jgi:carboxyl-terminal processing protease
MVNPDPSNHSSRFRQFAALLGLVLLLLAVGFGGYAYGATRQTAVPTPLPTSAPVVQIEQVEVTREVVVVFTPTPQPTATAVEMVVPADVPTAAETSLAPRPTAEAASSAPPDSGIYDEVWDVIEGEFDGELPADQERIYGAITGSLQALDDPYTRYLRPEIAERMRDDLDGRVSGIGAFVRETDDGYVEIARPMDGQPADLAGVKAGDVILAVDGESVLELSFDEVLLLVRGPEGSTVTLTLAREGEPEPLDIDVVRAVFEVAVVESELLTVDDQQIAYVRLSSFSQAAEQSVLDALRPMLAENPTGIIFDLRDNGGGFLDQAVSVADIFLPQGIVLYERSDNGLNETFNAFDGDIGESLPLVVLVNGGSASASEIVAGAIQDNERGVLIGETTFGKGSVQHVHTLSDGSELRVTIARWYTPGDRSISDNGVDPDIEVPTPADLGGEEDTQLQTAGEYLLGRN